MKLAAYFTCALMCPLATSSPLTFHVGLGPGPGSGGVSSGPGLGGTPMLVDTSAHADLFNGSPMGRSNLQSDDIRITPRKPAVVQTELPIIRPATNVQKNEYREDGILYALLRSLRSYFSSQLVSSPPSVVNVAIDPSNTVAKSILSPEEDSSAFRLALATRTRNLLPAANLDLEAAALPVIRPATNVNVQSRGLPVIRPATNVQARGLSIIRPATNVAGGLNVEQLPIIRPATNTD